MILRLLSLSVGVVIVAYHMQHMQHMIAHEQAYSLPGVCANVQWCTRQGDLTRPRFYGGRDVGESVFSP